MTKKYYTTTEVARVLRLSRMGVFKRIRQGKIKAERAGRNYIIHYDDLLEALGRSVGQEKKESIEGALAKALKQYGETFKKLGRE